MDTASDWHDRWANISNVCEPTPLFQVVDLKKTSGYHVTQGSILYTSVPVQVWSSKGIDFGHKV